MSLFQQQEEEEEGWGARRKTKEVMMFFFTSFYFLPRRTIATCNYFWRQGKHRQMNWKDTQKIPTQERNEKAKRRKDED